MPLFITLLCVMMILLLVCIYYSWSNLMISINQIDIISEFPINGLPHAQQLENSDLHFKYHGSFLTMLSVAIAVFAAVLTFAAFYIQYDFNRKQHIDLERERCENQFFHIMDIYRDICKGMSVAGAGTNKQAFHYMFYEYKALYNIFKKRIRKPEEISQQEFDSKLNRSVFDLFINGVSEKFSLTGFGEFFDDDTSEQLKRELLTLQQNSEQNSAEKKIDGGVVYIMDYKGRNIKYFDGHRLRLIPYFKFVYLLIEFISKNQSANQQSFDAIKYLTAELSEHEIGLLYAFDHSNIAQELASGHTDSEMKYIIERIYESLPSRTANKFKFDKQGFITI